MKSLTASGYLGQIYPGVHDWAVKEWITAIKGDGPESSANFDDAACPTEMLLLRY